METIGRKRKTTRRAMLGVGATVPGSSRDNAWQAGTWQAETQTEDEALRKLATEWDDLYERCSAATAFTSFAWLDSWWRSYGKPGQLVVVTVRHAGRLVAAAAMTRQYRLGLSGLTTLGAGISDFSDVLIDDRYAAQAACHLARELARQAGHTIDLREVPEGAAVWRVAAAWPRQVWRMRGSTCLALPVRPLGELIEALPRNTARTRRKKRRRIERAGITSRAVASHDAADGIMTLLRLHQAQWQGRAMNPEHGRPRFAAHLRRAVPAMVDRGQAVLVEHARDGQPVAVELLVAGHQMIGAYLFGHRPDLRQSIDVAQLLLQEDLEVAWQRGVPTLSLLRGDEPYKRQWRPRESHNERLLLAGRGRLPALYAMGVRGRHGLALLVKSRMPKLGTAVRAIRRRSPFSM